MDPTKPIDGLKLFTEKADKLYGMNFTTALLTDSVGFRMRWAQEDGGMGVSERYGPSEESMEAFVLTFRYFVQDNEPCSLRNMSKHFQALASGGLISQDLAERWEQSRANINRYLEKSTFLTERNQLPGGTITSEETYTHGRIMEVFLYGGLAHANKEKKALYDSWRAKALFYPMIEGLFVSTIGRLVLALNDLNKQLVKPALAQAIASIERNPNS